MTNCLLDYILLRDGCNGSPAPVPTSGLYLELVEGMGVENIAAITPEKLQTATKLVAEKLNFAGIIVETRLRGLLAMRGLELNSKGKISNSCAVTTAFNSPVAADKGLFVSQQWLGSQSAAIWVESIKIKSVNSGATTLKISDLSGNMLWSFPFTTIADFEHVVSVRQHFREQNILITADSTNLSLYQYACNASTSCVPCVQESKYLKVQGWSGTNISTVGYLGACMSLDCTDVDILCQYLTRQGVKLAILYQLAAEIAKEWVSPNNRLNIFKTHGEEWATTKQKDWEGMSIDYLNLDIDAIIQLMKTDKYCYNCKGRIVGNAMIP